MAFHNKKLLFLDIGLIALCITFLVGCCILFSYIEKLRTERRHRMENLFANYDTLENVASVSRVITYGDYKINIGPIVDSNDQILVIGDNYYYVVYGSEFHHKYSIHFYEGSFSNDGVTLMYSKYDVQSCPCFNALDNKFYISYKQEKKNIIDVYDVITGDYYNYSGDYQEELDDAVSSEQRNEYHYDLKVIDENSFSIQNIDTNETVIIDEDFIEKSSFSYEMSLLDYKASKIYISQGHIVVIYLIGIDEHYLSSVAYEYLVGEEDLRFIYFDWYRSSLKYIFVE